MPRKSGNDNIIPLPGRRRPDPPGHLDAVEQRAWRAIVDASPDGFIDGAGQQILRRAVSQLSVCERLEARLRNLGADDDLETELALAKAHQAAAKTAIYLMTSLRTTPRSRLTSRTTGRAFARSPSGRRPWDIRASVIDADVGDDDGGSPA